jgi:hypothetical protein
MLLAWRSSGLGRLWQHPICCLEVFSGIRDERCVARMIDRFHSDDDRHPLRVVPMNVLDEFGLCAGRPSDENRTGICNRAHDRAKKIVIFRGMSASDGVSFMMDVSRRMIRMQDESFDVRRAEMENAGFVMINPDDGVMVMVVHEIKTLSRYGPAATCFAGDQLAE